MQTENLDKLQIFVESKERYLSIYDNSHKKCLYVKHGDIFWELWERKPILSDLALLLFGDPRYPVCQNTTLTDIDRSVY